MLHLESMKRAVLSLFLFFISLASLLVIPAFSGTGRVAYAQSVVDQSLGEAACRSVTTQNSECKGCFDSGGAWTAIGCFGGDSPNAFIASFIRLGTGLGGGVAFLLILFSGFQRITSAGNPEKLHEAKELMTAAISGLLLIIFSVFLLRLIGVDILQFPGFTSG